MSGTSASSCLYNQLCACRSQTFQAFRQSSTCTEVDLSRARPQPRHGTGERTRKPSFDLPSARPRAYRGHARRAAAPAKCTSRPPWRCGTGFRCASCTRSKGTLRTRVLLHSEDQRFSRGPTSQCPTGCALETTCTRTAQVCETSSCVHSGPAHTTLNERCHGSWS